MVCGPDAQPTATSTHELRWNLIQVFLHGWELPARHSHESAQRGGHSCDAREKPGSGPIIAFVSELMVVTVYRQQCDWHL